MRRRQVGAAPDWRHVLAAFPVAALLLLAACNRTEPVYREQAYVFGTLVELTIHGVEEQRARQAAAGLFAKFQDLHRRLHAWQPGELTRINDAIAAGRDAPLDAELAAMLSEAAQFARRSGHLFNPAIGGLVSLWGFHADDFPARLPDPAALAQLVAAGPSMDDVAIGDGRVASRNSAVRLDLGGYAKGHALDVAAAYLQEQGIGNALINVGGNIMALGRHGERPWRVGIQHPRKPGPMATLELADGEAVGTSGDYQRFFELEGRRYCHLIDPRTGQPVQGVQAATVVVPRGPGSGAFSDAASKPLFIEGTRAWREAARSLGVEMAMLVDAEGRVFVTRALGERLTFVEPRPEVFQVP